MKWSPRPERSAGPSAPREGTAFGDLSTPAEEAARANLRRLTEVARALNTEAGLPHLLGVVLDRVVEFARAERAFVILRKADGTPTVAASRNLDREAVPRASSKISRAIFLQTVRTGRPVLSTNASMDPRFSSSDSVAHMRLRAVLCVPLSARGRSLGVLYLDNRFEEGVFRDVDLDLMEAFGAQAAIAIEDARHQEAAAERARALEGEIADKARAERRLATLNAATRLLAEASEPADAVPSLVRCLAEGLGWEVGGAWEVDDEAGTLRCLHAWHSGGEALERVAAGLRGRVFRKGEGMPGRAWATGAAEWCRDVVNDPRHPREGAVAAGLHAAVAFPVTVGGGVRGVLAFLSLREIPEDAELLAMMASVGTQLGQFVERKRADGARARAEALLRQGQKMEAIGRLAGGVAHDFNNLLTVILGFAHLAASEAKADDPAREHLHEVQEAAMRAAALTRQLLAFSRRQVLDVRDVDLDAVVAGMEKMLRRLLGEDIELEFEAAPSPAIVRADPGRIEQVLLNLLVNARDAMPGGGRILVRTSEADLDEEYLRARAPECRPGPYVALSVADSGTGIPADVLPRIFEPFFTTKEEGEGTGLGLATVYGIVRQCGGHLSVYSEPGQGTVFKVFLPRSRGEDTGAGGPPPARPPRRGSERVLLAEDDPQLRELTRRLLEARGYRVRAAADAEGALAAAAAEGEPFDLLVTDVVMPRMDGTELARRLREGRPGLRVLFMSGYTGRSLERRGMLRSAAEFLEKPFSADALAEKVRAALDAPPPGAGPPPGE